MLTYDPNNGFFSEDLAILYPDTPFSSPGITKLAPMAINQSVTVATYGIPGTPSAGFQAQDGLGTAFGSYIRDFGSSFYSSAYASAPWSAINQREIAFHGRLSNFGSGSPVLTNLNGDWALSGIATGISGSTLQSGSTLIYNVGNGNPFILAATALPGDSNFDKAVNFDDLLAVAQHYGQLTGQSWSNGDFTFDAAVNFDDLLILAQHYGQTAPTLTNVSPDFAADWTLARSLVPEPTAMLAFVVTPFLRRRRAQKLGGRFPTLSV